jgi:hypothetical protein
MFAGLGLYTHKLSATVFPHRSLQTNVSVRDSLTCIQLHSPSAHHCWYIPGFIAYVVQDCSSVLIEHQSLKASLV